MLTNSHILTAEGQSLITRSLVENKKVDFLYYKAGNGDVNSIDAIKLLKDISGALIKKFDVALISKISTSTTNISGQYDNTGVVTSQQVKEYGLFAKLEGDSKEILFSYQGLGDGFILPLYSGTLIMQIVDFTITMTQEVGVVVRFNPSALVGMQTFFEELNKKVDKTAIKTEQLTNTNTDFLSSSAARKLFENGAGGRCLGYVEDGGEHVPHDTNFWISKTLPGQFRCVVSNSDRYIDADKWLPIDDNSNASKLKNLIEYKQIEVPDAILDIIGIDLGDRYYVIISGNLATRFTYDLSGVLSEISSLEAIHLGSDTKVNIVSSAPPSPRAIVFNDNAPYSVGISATITGFLIK